MFSSKRLLGIFLIAVTPASAIPASHFAGAFAHPLPQSTAPVPIPAPPPVLPSQTAAATALQDYKTWNDNSHASHDTSIQQLWSSKVTDEQSIQTLEATVNSQGTQIAAMQVQIATLQAQLMPIIPAVLHIEAESAVASNGSIVSQTTTDTGGGLNLSNIADGQWFEYHINVPVAGSYNMVIRAATPYGTRSIHVEFPVGTNVSGPLAVPNTGGYQSWTTVPVGNPIPFPQGTVVFRMVCDTGRLNLNWYEFTRQ